MTKRIAPHVAAYQAWMKAANTAKATTPEREEKRQARIIRLKEKYERLVAKAMRSNLPT